MLYIIVFFDLKNRFELLDSKGKLVFYAGETLEDCGEGTNECLGARSSVIFDVSILGRNGGGIINIRANKAGVSINIFISYTKFKQEHESEEKVCVASC